MQRLRKAYGKKTFADAKIPLYILTADFLSGEQVVLTEGLLVDAIRASIAIPFVFEPWEIDGQLMVDGAVVDPMPVDVAIRENADVIISLGFESPYQRKLNSVVRYAFQVTTVMTNSLFRANYAFHALSHHTEVLSIIPEFDERIGAFDTTKVPTIIEAGARAMEQQLPYLRRLLGLNR